MSSASTDIEAQCSSEGNRNAGGDGGDSVSGSTASGDAGNGNSSGASSSSSSSSGGGGGGSSSSSSNVSSSDNTHGGGHEKEEQNAGPVWLFICFAGLMGSGVLFGMILEYATSGGRKLHELSYIFVTSAIYSITARFCRDLTGEIHTTIPLYKLLGLAILSMSSSFTSVRSLRYVIFPVQVLAKSCKPIPVMIMGAMMGKKYPLSKYINVAVITLGVALFMGGGSSSSKHRRLMEDDGVLGAASMALRGWRDQSSEISWLRGSANEDSRSDMESFNTMSMPTNTDSSSSAVSVESLSSLSKFLRGVGPSGGVVDRTVAWGTPVAAALGNVASRAFPGAWRTDARGGDTEVTAAVGGPGANLNAELEVSEEGGAGGRRKGREGRGGQRNQSAAAEPELSTSSKWIRRLTAAEDAEKSGPMMWFGVLLLFVSLSFDGATGAYEDEIMQAGHLGPFELMYNIQFGKMVIAFLCLLFFNEINYFFDLVYQTGFTLLALGLAGAMLQISIFVTISKFGALTCALFGIARKITTLVVSIFFFGHVLNFVQAGGLIISIAAMIYNFTSRFFKSSGKKPAPPPPEPEPQKAFLELVDQQAAEVSEKKSLLDENGEACAEAADDDAFPDANENNKKKKKKKKKKNEK